MRDPALLVLDTNVLISAVLFGGTPEAIVNLCRSGKTQLVTSDAILVELSGVLRRKFGMEGRQVVAIVEELRSFAMVVVPATTLNVIEVDPDDNRVLECAVEARADFIVSGDTRHLLPLGEYDGISIVSPAGLSDRLTGDLGTVD